ncbi:MAG: hypothetical protein J6D23_02805 [Clostridia bacterium]|nr:hypothetical protein [Clostridia bacterium]
MERNISGKLNIRKKFVYLLVAVFLIIECISIVSCAGLSDWSYELPNGYCVSRVNSADISILREREEFSALSYEVVVDRYVICFCYNDVYVCARRLDVPQYGGFDPLELNVEEADYNIVNTETREVYKGLTEDEYNELCSQLGIIELCDWIDTYPKPKGAK